MLSKYDSFLENLILENMINESVVYYTPELRKLFNKIFNKGNKIAIDFVNTEGKNIKPDVTFIDLDKDGYFSFITMRNAVNLINKKYPHIVDRIVASNVDTADQIWRNDKNHTGDKTEIFTKSRNQIKIGKIIKKFFPDKYTDKEIEDFVNIFKAYLNKENETFEIVEGDAIEFWYNSDNYKERKGSLGNSCMANKNNIFNIYTKNPEVCRLLILKDDDKLIGRALIWKLSNFHDNVNIDEIKNKPEYFLDRQYTLNDSDVERFRLYAKEKGWAYKKYNNHHSFDQVQFNDQDLSVSMSVKVKKYSENSYDYVRYPYLDTFRRYDVNSGYLYNDNENEEIGQYILEDTDGGYVEIANNVYSEWYDREIAEEDSVWSEPLGDYIFSDRSVEVQVGSRRNHGFYPEDYDDIKYDKFLDGYVHIDDLVYSDEYEDDLWEGHAVNVIYFIDSDGVTNTDNWYMYKNDENIIRIDGSIRNTIWYEKISDNQSWESFDYIMKSLLVKDYLNNWIPKEFEMTEYKIDSNIDNIDYLSKEDAISLNYTIGEKNRIVDKFSYNKKISSIKNLIKKSIKLKIKELKYKLSGNQLSLDIDEIKYDKELEIIKTKKIISLLELRLNDIIEEKYE